jgi:hypothetical protein
MDRVACPIPAGALARATSEPTIPRITVIITFLTRLMFGRAIAD